jgi:hypothetical protein
MHSITLFKGARNYMKSLIDALSEKQLTTIPEGYNNHIFWHLGHVVVTQQLLHYRRSGLPLHIDENLIDLFKNGSSPRDWSDPPDPGRILSLLNTLPERLAQDYADERFKGITFDGFTTRSGFELNSIDQAIVFNNYHEGIHAGYLMAMRRLV